MDLDQLRLFVDLVREQSFTRVAARNFITQPAVSQSIQKLEDELGTRLLERSTRRVTVTEDGRILFEYAREILEKAQEARLVLQERQNRVVGSVRLATVHSIGLYELPASLKEFIRRYPEVHIHIDYQLSDQVCRSVVEGESDLGLVAFPNERPNLVVIPFLEDEVVLICSPEHRFAGQDAVALAELSGEPFVSFQAEIPTRKATDSLLEEHGVRVEVRLECDNIEILKKMVEVGLGISLVPNHSVREEARRRSLCVLRLKDHMLKRPLAIVHRKGKTLSRPQKAFIELLTREGGDLLAADLARG